MKYFTFGKETDPLVVILHGGGSSYRGAEPTARLLMAGAFLYGGYDGIRNGFPFRKLFLRFLVMLYLWKAFDVVCLDWLLLTRSHFFQHYYPETEGCAGYHQFGFNRKEQLIRILLFPFVAALMAVIALWLGK